MIVAAVYGVGSSSESQDIKVFGIVVLLCSLVRHVNVDLMLSCTE